MVCVINYIYFWEVEINIFFRFNVKSYFIKEI